MPVELRHLHHHVKPYALVKYLHPQLCHLQASLDSIFRRLPIKVVNREVARVLRLVAHRVLPSNIKLLFGVNVMSIFSDLPLEIQECADRQEANKSKIESELHNNTIYVVAVIIRAYPSRKITIHRVNFLTTCILVKARCDL